ncbi:GtrA family protein [Microbacterium sp. NPDC055357]
MRYLVVGGFCFLVDIGLLWLLHDAFHVPLAIATPIAFLASFIVTYSLQRIVAFSSDAKVAPSVGRYTLLVVFNTVATTGIVAGFAALGVPWVIGKVVAVAATTVWNYFAYRFWVFARPNTTNPKDDHDV